MERNDLLDLIEAVTSTLIEQRGGSREEAPLSTVAPASTSEERSTPAPPRSNTDHVLEGVGALDIENLIGGIVGDLSTRTTAARVQPVASTDHRAGSDWITQFGRSFISGFGVASLFRGLFGGDSDEEQELPLPRVELPPSINAELAYDRRTGGYTNANYDVNGTPRGTPEQSVQVTVNVSAIDSKSFLDHSSAIARAVREAVLNSHSLNDVLSEL